MYVETVVQVNERDTYQATVRTRTAVAAGRPGIDALVRFSPPGWLTVKPLTGGPVSVLSAAEVLDVVNLERVQAGEQGPPPPASGGRWRRQGG